MANYVKVKINTSVPVMNTDFEVVVKNDSGKLGTLLISKGNLEWRPKGNSVNKRRLTWGKFAEFMEEHGKPVKNKKNYRPSTERSTYSVTSSQTYATLINK